MRKLLIIVPLLAILAGSLWFAVYAWNSMAGTALPAYAYWAMAGGILVSLLVGCGLMALVFYSSRHGYDDMAGEEPWRKQD